MRLALILAGGSGTRLWPFSRRAMPKQLLPLVGGRSLFELALQRLEGLVQPDNLRVCAAEQWRDQIARLAPGLGGERFIGEPVGRDTLPALAVSAAVIALEDPGATLGVFTADHLIGPPAAFGRAVASGYDLVESQPDLLLTFGVTPTRPATGYGYLELGDGIPGGGAARRVACFREKPDAASAAGFLEAGPERYLWNSGMFLWKASTFLACVRRYRPAMADAAAAIAAAWQGPHRAEVLARVYPSLERISVDYGVMEPASVDPSVRVAAFPLALDWKDIGSWSSFAEVCRRDEAGNAVAAGQSALVETRDSLVASSDPDHLVAVVGCEGLVVVHTPDATLVCRADRAEQIKKLQELLSKRSGQQRYT